MVIVVVALKSPQWEGRLGSGQSIQVPVVVQNPQPAQPAKRPSAPPATEIRQREDSVC